MISDILKILLEEPERIRSLFIKFVKLILSIILASHMYIWIIGPYHLINYLSIAQWVEFVMSGRVLIVLLIFIVSDFVIFSFLPGFTSGLLIWIARKTSYKGDGKEERHFIRWFLKIFNIIEYDETSKKVLAGPNAKVFESALEYMVHDEGRDDFHQMKNSFLNEIVHSYLIFTLIFSLYINNFEIAAISKYVYFLAFILIAFYLSLSFTISYIEKNASSLLSGINHINLRLQ
jgi:hypothetical protein